MDNPILTVLWIVTTYFLFNIVWAFFEGIQQGMQEMRDDLKEELNEIVHVVETEHRGDMQYWFDKDSGQFLGQGTTESDVIRVLKSRFPEHMFYISKGNKHHLLSANTEWEMWHVTADLTKIQ